MNQDSILKFKPNVHPALWGGESWEISVHPAGPSVIREGVLAGKPLSEAAPGFPLLVKVIDAKMRLSVQVHPNETTCKLTGGEAKCSDESEEIRWVTPEEATRVVTYPTFDKRLKDMLAAAEDEQGIVFSTFKWTKDTKESEVMYQDKFVR